MGSRGSDSRRRKLKAKLRQREDCCWLCGLPLQDDAPPMTTWATEIDEELPASKGGDVYGVQTPCHLVHRCCNIHKSDKIVTPGCMRDYALMLLGVANSAKPSHEW